MEERRADPESGWETDTSVSESDSKTGSHTIGPPVCKRSGCYRKILIARNISGSTFLLSRYCVYHTCEARDSPGSFCPHSKHSDSRYCRRHEEDSSKFLIST